MVVNRFEVLRRQRRVEDDNHVCEEEKVNDDVSGDESGVSEIKAENERRDEAAIDKNERLEVVPSNFITVALLINDAAFLLLALCHPFEFGLR